MCRHSASSKITSPSSRPRGTSPGTAAVSLPLRTGHPHKRAREDDCGASSRAAASQLLRPSQQHLDSAEQQQQPPPEGKGQQPVPKAQDDNLLEDLQTVNHIIPWVACVVLFSAQNSVRSYIYGWSRVRFAQHINVAAYFFPFVSPHPTFSLKVK